jgi:antitoxin MazE
MYIHQGTNMNLHIAKWGNSLAVRIPVEYIRRTGLKDGDTVKASLMADGTLTIRAEPWDRKAFTDNLAQTRRNMKMGTSVMDELRNGARY